MVHYPDTIIFSYGMNKITKLIVKFQFKLNLLSNIPSDSGKYFWVTYAINWLLFGSRLLIGRIQNLIKGYYSHH